MKNLIFNHERNLFIQLKKESHFTVAENLNFILNFNANS